VPTVSVPTEIVEVRATIASSSRRRRVLAADVDLVDLALHAGVAGAQEARAPVRP
jgi:hypothetical protein